MSGSSRDVCVTELSPGPFTDPPPVCPDLGEDCVLAGGVPGRAAPVLHGKAAVDVQAGHEAGLAAF